MKNKYVLDMDTNFDDCTYVLIANSKGEEEHASFKNEKDAQEYIQWKNNQAVQKAKIEAVIEFIRFISSDIGKEESKTIIKMLEDLK